ncbi:MAG: hypothetical protein KAW12_13955 [Candidatus Aminicenantes bacterium]|nr:hypothetical protein [Candidatus Aminicenantes bacterium]
MHEIFLQICLDRDIEVEDFDFFRAVSQIIKGIEQLAKKETEFADHFQTNPGKSCSSEFRQIKG